MDARLYVLHGFYFATFLLRLFGARGAATAKPTTTEAQAAAPGARLMLVSHAFAFFLLYFGMGWALGLRRGQTPSWGLGECLGTALIAAGALLTLWTLPVFRSWRLLAHIESGHELCTEGPFRLVRHPIYAGLVLLALGTLTFLPDVRVLPGVLLVALVGDLRARTEERVLLQAFGPAYSEYSARVARFVPGVY